MILTHKIALNPTQEQVQYFRKAAGTARFVYNWALAECNEEHAAGRKTKLTDLKKRFNALYPVCWPWVAEVHRDCHSQPFYELENAFKRFFSGKAKCPRFKSKRNRASFYVAIDKRKASVLCDLAIRLPIIGWIRMREKLRFKGKLVGGFRIVEECSRWFICVSVDGDFSRERTADGEVGIDVGIRHLATFSTGECIANPKPLQKALKRLQRAQRKLSRRKKGSKNREKQRRKVARVHRRVRNIRRDVLHKLSTRVCRENQTVAVESLCISEMLKDGRFARNLIDVALRMLRSMLEYKVQRYGSAIIAVDRYFPSSKRCSSCNKVKAELKGSVYRCECGLLLDRDVNAAINILAAARGEVTPAEIDNGQSTKQEP